MQTKTVAAQQPPETLELNYKEVLSLAQVRATLITIAQARTNELEAERKKAGVWQYNPQVSVMAGPRFGSIQNQTDWSVSAQQWLEVWGQRGHRIDIAQHGLEAGNARQENMDRLLKREVQTAFATGLFWTHRVALAQDQLRITRNIAELTSQRYTAGDIGGLDKSMADLAVVRAKTKATRTQVALTRAHGDLKSLLGISASTQLNLRGELQALLQPDPCASSAPSTRADLRAIEAEVQQAEAETKLGRSSRWPKVSVGMRYAKEQFEDIYQGILTVSLPVFSHGQGLRAIAEARKERLQTELKIAQHQANIEVHTARSITQKLSSSASQFEAEGLAHLQEAARLASKSYEVGAIPLVDLLAVRRQLLAAKVEYLELLLEAAIAQVELRVNAGTIP